MSNVAWEKLQAATLSLIGPGPLKDRLTDAYRNHLSQLEEAELPKELRDDYRILRDAMTRERPSVRGEDSCRATIRKMSNDEAQEVASWVVRMLCAVPRGPATLPRERLNFHAQVVPLYIAEPDVDAPDETTAEDATEQRPSRIAKG